MLGDVNSTYPLKSVSLVVLDSPPCEVDDSWFEEDEEEEVEEVEEAVCCGERICRAGTRSGVVWVV